MLTPAALLSIFERRGIRLVVRAGRIFAPAGELEEADKAQLRALKPELLGLLIEREAGALLDCYQERAAIAEVDGGLARADAEALARGELLAALSLTGDELGILQRDPWQVVDLLRITKVRAMTGGAVVPLPAEVERLASGERIKPKWEAA